MNEERDPRIQRLFADATENLGDDEFTARVMARVERHRRAGYRLWTFIFVMALLAAWMLQGPFQEIAMMLSRALAISLFQVDSPLVAQLVMPLNTIAGLLGLGVLALTFLYRRILA